MVDSVAVVVKTSSFGARYRFGPGRSVAMHDHGLQRPNRVLVPLCLYTGLHDQAVRLSDVMPCYVNTVEVYVT